MPPPATCGVPGSDGCFGAGWLLMLLIVANFFPKHITRILVRGG
jgi:hypothetical protein